MAQEKNVDDKPSDSDHCESRHRKRGMCRSHSPPPATRSSPPYKRRKGDDHDSGGSSSRHYQDYGTMKRIFFNAHKHEDWLKDKYHPTNLLALIKQRKEVARKLAEDFKRDLFCNKLDIGPAADPKGAEESDLSAAPKAHPVSSEPIRILFDIRQALALVKKLDVEKGISNNVLWKSHGCSSGPVGPFITVQVVNALKRLKGVELLDTLLTYLWRIHGVDYYGMTETPKPQGLRHVRAEAKGVGSSCSDFEWDNELDSCWEERIENEDPLEVMAAEERVDAATTEALKPHISKVSDHENLGWKYGCEVEGCTEFFPSWEFVLKHFKLKHKEFVMELTSKLLHDLCFHNFINDFNGPGVTPAMQQQQPQVCVEFFHLPLLCLVPHDLTVPICRGRRSFFFLIGCRPMDPFAPEFAMQMLRLQDSPSPLGSGSEYLFGGPSGHTSGGLPSLEGGSKSGLGSGHHIVFAGTMMMTVED